MYLTNAIECFLLLASSERRLRPKTLKAYRLALDQFDGFASERGRANLEDFTPNLVRACGTWLMEDRDRATTFLGGEAMVKQLVTATRCMVKRLREEYPDLPLPDLSTVHPPKMPLRIQPRLRDGEFGALEAAIRLRLMRERVPRFLVARDLAILQVLSNTGLRASECCGLKVDDVDLQEGNLRVRDGKGGKERVLTILDPDPDERDGGEAIRALEDYLRYRERTFGVGRARALWLTQKGNPLSADGLRDALRSLCEEAGIDGNRPPHAFRRAHFTDQYRQAPTALPVLIERMGWTSETMARVYTRGAEVELARRHPLPLMSKQWRGAGKPIPKGRTVALSPSGAGPGRSKADGPPPPTLGRADGERTASASSRRGLRHPS